MDLFIPWFQCVWELRHACSRGATFMWMSLALLGLSVRPDLAGVTSFVRASWLFPETYRRLLHMFHSNGLVLETLTKLWIRMTLKLFNPLREGERLVCVADGLKVPKEGRKMPAVKKLHQESGDNFKAEFFFGHSFQVVGLLVQGALGQICSVPLASRIHEGVVFSNRDKRSLLDKLAALFLTISPFLDGLVILVADAYYASRKVIRPLLKKGHHLLTRVRSNTVAYYLAPKPSKPGPGRPRFYGDKVRLRDFWAKKDCFVTAPSPVYGETKVMLSYYSVDLLWRPIGKFVRFVLVKHPLRGRLILMTTDCNIVPLRVIALYGYRFKIEVSFKQALRTLGTYAYHFWMQAMTPIPRRSGNQYLHMKTDNYRRLVRRKMDAYHRYVQLGCIAQGLLQHLSLNYRKKVWAHFNSWMRTMNPSQPPSEAVVAQALRSSLPVFLLFAPDTHKLKKFISENIDFERCRPLQLVG
ncbi:MAG: transposase [Planctomycetota bacterium]